MTVRRIIANLPSDAPATVAGFYEDMFGLERVMDHGWIVTSASQATMAPQISFASEGGSGTDVPALSIEVDDVDAVHARAVSAGHSIPYGPVDEPWGVRRFYLRDPAGRTLNILSHKVS